MSVRRLLRSRWFLGASALVLLLWTVALALDPRALGDFLRGHILLAGLFGLGAGLVSVIARLVVVPVRIYKGQGSGLSPRWFAGASLFVVLCATSLALAHRHAGWGFQLTLTRIFVLGLLSAGGIGVIAGLIKSLSLINRGDGSGIRSRWFVRAAGTWLGLSALLVLLTVGLARGSVDFLANLAAIVLGGAGFLGAAMAFARAIVLLEKQNRSQESLALLVLIPILLLPVLILLASPRLYWWSRRQAFHGVAHRAQPMLAAIERYTADHHRPPPDLASLVPVYLDEVPRTGLLSYPDFGYWCDEEAWGLEIECFGLMTWDEFYYPPKSGDEHRPDIALIDGWAYYRE